MAPGRSQGGWCGPRVTQTHTDQGLAGKAAFVIV